MLTVPSEALVERLDTRFRDVESKLMALDHAKCMPVVEDAVNRISCESRPIEGSHLYEGDSSFTSVSLQASRNAQIAASSGPRNGSGIEHSLGHLGKMLNDSHELSKNTFFFSKSTSSSKAPLKALSATLVTSILRSMKGMLRLPHEKPRYCSPINQTHSPSSYFSFFLCHK